MRITLIVALVLHVLSGVFWAGTTFALARMRGNQADLFFRPQMGAAAIAVVTGGCCGFSFITVLWGRKDTFLPSGRCAHSSPSACKAWWVRRRCANSLRSARLRARDCAIAWQQASASPQPC